MPKKGKKWKPPAPAGRRPAPAEGAEPAEPTNRESRRLEAERRRDALRKSAKRRRRLRRFGIIGAILAVGGGVTAFVLTRPPAVDPAVEENRLLAQAPAALKSSGCDPVQTIDPYPGEKKLDTQHLPSVDAMPPITSYPSQPPVSGPHANIPPGPMPADFYSDPPNLARAIHSLEHGAVIIWYSPDAADSPVLSEIKDFFASSHESDHVLIAPYDYDQSGGQLPAGRQMALAAWHHLQFCDQLSLPVAFRFVRDYRPDINHRAAYKGDAREAGAAL